MRRGSLNGRGRGWPWGDRGSPLEVPVSELERLSRAYALLREALEAEVKDLSQLEREGVIQRFEYTFELAWNTLKDRLEYDGVSARHGKPAQRHSSGVPGQEFIDDGDAWIDMLTDRNLMAHTYDAARFEAVAGNVRRRYLAILGASCMNGWAKRRSVRERSGSARKDA